MNLSINQAINHQSIHPSINQSMNPSIYLQIQNKIHFLQPGISSWLTRVMIDAILYFLLHADEILAVDSPRNQVMTAVAVGRAPGVPARSQQPRVRQRRQSSPDVFVPVIRTAAAAANDADAIDADADADAAAADETGAAANAAFCEHLSLHDGANLRDGRLAMVKNLPRGRLIFSFPTITRIMSIC